MNDRVRGIGQFSLQDYRYDAPRRRARSMRPLTERLRDDNAGVRRQAQNEARANERRENQQRGMGMYAQGRELSDPRIPYGRPTHVEQLGQDVLETTGLPSVRRAVRAAGYGDAPTAALEGSMAALGLSGMIAPTLRGAAPRAAAEVLEAPPRLPNPAREIGPGGLPIRPRQEFRQSLVGGSGDLAEAASWGRTDAPSAPDIAAQIGMSEDQAMTLVRWVRSGRGSDEQRALVRRLIAADRASYGTPGATQSQLRQLLRGDAGSRAGVVDTQPIFEFLSSPRRDAWVNTGGYSVYLRKNEGAMIGGRRQRALEISSVKRADDSGSTRSLPINERGTGGGGFRALMNAVEDQARSGGFDGVYVENVINDFLPGVLSRRGYRAADAYGSGPPSYYLPVRGRADDLPMDEASRMARAREMGFDVDTPLYHGTQRDVAGAMRPSGSGANGPGVYVGTTPETAASYAGTPSRDGVRTQIGDRSVPIDFTRMPFGEAGGNIMPLVARGRLAPVTEYQQALRQAQKELRAPDQTRSEVQALAHAKLQERGYTGIRDEQSDFNVIFDPANVRSRFARFDPKNRDSNDLLAGIAPIGIAGGIAAATNHNKRKPNNAS
jgi:hypothetical protein